MERDAKNDPPTEPKIRTKRPGLNFKRAAVELWLQGGKSAAVVVPEIGISGQTLQTLKLELSVPPPFSLVPSPAQLQEENRHWRRELTGVLRRCDLLKNDGTAALKT